MNSWFEDNGNNVEGLGRDDCYVQFVNGLGKNVHIYSVYKECLNVSHFNKYQFIVNVLINISLCCITLQKKYKWH